ncbi:MAG: PilZ domain-containing protein [Acidobacteriota bacterium]
MTGEYSSLDPRLRLSLPVVAEWHSNRGAPLKVWTFSNNISANGMSIILDPNAPELMLTIGQQINVIIDGMISTKARVVHFTERKDRFLNVGLQLPEPIYEWLWLYKAGNPHLLNESTLMKLPHPERRRN